MNETESHLERPLHTAERQRILAARGWESDRDRTEVLRELLTPHLERVFLWSYSRLRNRDQALDLTRSTLMWVSRTLTEIPEDCSLDAWIFEQLAVESRARLPLVRSELGQAPRLVLDDFPNERYLVDYPETKKLLDAFRNYMSLPSDLHLVSRSGWSRAAEDLHHFMEAQFGEKDTPHPPSRLPRSMRILHELGNPKVIGSAVIVAAALALVLNLWLDKRRLESEVNELRAVVATLHDESPGNLDPAGESAGDRISLAPASAELDGDRLTVTWATLGDAAFYRLVFCTARMDTLYWRNGIRDSHHDIPVKDISNFSPEGNYLFKVDAMRGMEVLGSTGYLPYPPI